MLNSVMQFSKVHVEEDDGVFEPLFDYSSIQPSFLNHIGDESDDAVHGVLQDRIFGCEGNSISISNDKSEIRKDRKPFVDREGDDEKDWLPAPPKSFAAVRAVPDENPILTELRLKRMELMSLTTTSFEDVLRNLEESAKKDLQQSAISNVDTSREHNNASGSSSTRRKVIITVQNKEENYKFCIYMDDKFEKLFKAYAESLNAKIEDLVFRFDGEKLYPFQTPEELGMEDDDIVEVYPKK